MKKGGNTLGVINKVSVDHVYQFLFAYSFGFCCVCDLFYTVFVYFVSVGLIFGWP